MHQLYRVTVIYTPSARHKAKLWSFERTKICGFLPKQATVTMSFIYSKIYSSCQSDTPFKQTELRKQWCIVLIEVSVKSQVRPFLVLITGCHGSCWLFVFKDFRKSVISGNWHNYFKGTLRTFFVFSLLNNLKMFWSFVNWNPYDL